MLKNLSAAGRHAARNDLLTIYTAAVEAVDGRRAVRSHLQQKVFAGSVTLVAVGKAAQSMALGAHDVLGQAIRNGLVISKPGHLDPHLLRTLGLEAIAGGHPVPAEGSLEAGRRLLQLLRDEALDDVLFLVSGGASSLVEVPVAGLNLADLERAGEWLLGSGLPISAMNWVRKSLSAVKGGGLLRWTEGLRINALAVSDVPGDDPAVIGSGLLVPELELAQRVRTLDLPAWLEEWVKSGLRERVGLPAGGPALAIVAGLDQAKEAAAVEARRLGYPVVMHGEFIGGDAGEAGKGLAHSLLVGPAGVQVWGGETTVVLPPKPGRGGRNQHLALAAATTLSGRQDCLLLSAGTDGTDGPTDYAGALVDGDTLKRAEIEGFDSAQTLRSADAGRLLEATGDLIRTGPTGTNVMDLMLGLKVDAHG